MSFPRVYDASSYQWPRAVSRAAPARDIVATASRWLVRNRPSSLLLSCRATLAGDCCVIKYAVIFLIISLIAGALGMANVSRIAKRISLMLCGLFFLVFLALIVFALVTERSLYPSPPPIPAMLITSVTSA
jgi:uncharacterized membrane protein YtjA (UPF0391 family)